MNNIDKKKVIKMFAILAAICIGTGILAAFLGGNSMTLTEYVEQNSGALQETSMKTKEAAPTDTKETAPLANTEETAAPTETAAETPLLTDVLQKEENLSEDAFYFEPLSEEQARDLPISADHLRYVHILYNDFDGNPAEGELICNEAIAEDLAEIFYELYRQGYQLEKVRLIDEYGGDDLASMEDNNTSCFNYRVVEGTTSLSKHAYGLAVDINPLYNPYITYNEDGSENISPESAADYANREASFPYKIDENDLAYKLFKEHGFTWGGDWNSCKDYQHFEKKIN